MKSSKQTKRLPDVKKREIYPLTDQQKSNIIGGKNKGGGTLIPTSATPK